MARKKRSARREPARRPVLDGRRSDKPGSDYLLDAAEEVWPSILAAYRHFEDKKPLVLYDIQERRIYVYPYLEFKQDLSERSQRMLEEQYERALPEGKIVVFVRDNEQRRLVSFSMEAE